MSGKEAWAKPLSKARREIEGGDQARSRAAAKKRLEQPDSGRVSFHVSSSQPRYSIQRRQKSRTMARFWGKKRPEEGKRGDPRRSSFSQEVRKSIGSLPLSLSCSLQSLHAPTLCPAEPGFSSPLSFRSVASRPEESSSPLGDTPLKERERGGVARFVSRLFSFSSFFFRRKRCFVVLTRERERVFFLLFCFFLFSFLLLSFFERPLCHKSVDGDLGSVFSGKRKKDPWVHRRSPALFSLSSCSACCRCPGGKDVDVDEEERLFQTSS